MIKFFEIPGHKGYFISREGVIVGLRGTVLKPYIDPDGYARVSMKRDSKHMCRGVHQVICETFNGPRPEGMMACHRDGSRSNNDPENLYWGRAQDNSDDAARHGTRKGAHAGEDHHMAKLKTKEVAEILHARKLGHTQKQVAEKFGITRTLVSLIENGKRWRNIQNVIA